MATAKKGARSTKTAHVLNLLAPNAEKEAAAPEADTETGAEVPQTPGSLEPASRPLAPPILEVARANDAQIADQIRDALAEEFPPPPESQAEPEPEPEPISDPTPESEPDSEPEPDSVLVPESELESEPESASIPELEPESEPEPAPASMPEPEAEPALLSEPEAATPVPELSPQPEPESSLLSDSELPPHSEPEEAEGTPEPTPASPAELEPEPPSEPAGSAPDPESAHASMLEPSAPEPPPSAPEKPAENFAVVNIMEHLVEMKAPRYIKMFGLCSCARCAADVKALTLTSLQPSYLVVPKAEVQGMITVYESRYNSTIFAQLTRACKVVMDNPRHKDS